jgi:putative ABC transport system substrate-binding protein
MSAKFLVWLLASFLVTTVSFAQAQLPARIPRIGYISGTGDATNQGPYVAALRQGLRDLGYVVGKHFAIEFRGADGKPDRMPRLVTERVQLKVDVLASRLLQERSASPSRRPRLSPLSW